MRKLHTLIRYACARHSVSDFIFTKKGHKYAAQQLKASPMCVTVSVEDICEFEEDVVYRDNGITVYTPNFDYTPSAKSRSPNSILYYTSRGWSEEEADVLITKHRKDHISKESAKYDSRKRPWNPEFWKSYGLEGETAVNMAHEFQKKSLTYFTFRFGEDLGLKKYNKCVENRKNGISRRKHTEIQNIIRYSSQDYVDAVETYRMRRVVVSPRRVEYWLNKGFSLKEAVLRVKQWQSEISPRTIDHWLKNGYSLDQARTRISELQANNSIPAIMSRYDCNFDIACDIQRHFLEKAIETKRLNKTIRSEHNQLEFIVYAAAVRRATERNYRRYQQKIDPMKLRSHEYQLDHKYPVVLGFENNVPVCIMACEHNLEIISAEQNRNKGTTPSIQLCELYKLYET